MKECKVLIVDDLVLNRILLSEIMMDAGYVVKMAKNGKEAIDKIQEEAFDIVFMDMEMPVMNGFEATRYIKNKLPFPLNQIPVVAVSAHDPVTFWEEYVSLGFKELLSKPFSVEKIKNLVSEIMENKE